MKFIKYWLIILVVLLLGGFFLSSKINLTKSHETNGTYDKKITVSGKNLMVEIAKTSQAREQGLSDREKMCSNCGMVFIFDQPDIYTFWMRRMYFDLDMLWLNRDKVVDITYSAKAPLKEEFETPKELYQSKVPADKVIEVNSGWAKKNGIKIGDKLQL